MSAMSSSVICFGAVASSRRCFIAADQVGDVAVGVADRTDPGRDADVAHQLGEHPGEERGWPFGSSAPGARSRAARWWRSGEASKVNRKASGAVSDTAMPCGTIGSSAG